MTVAQQIETAAGPDPSPEPKTVAELLLAYAEARRVAKEVGAKTLRAYHGRVKSIRARNPTIADLRVCDLERRHVVMVREAYREVPGMGSNVLALLRSALAWAVDVGLLDANPASNVKGYTRKGGRRKDFSRSEARALIRALELAHVDQAITEAGADYFRVALVLGWRPHQILGLRTLDLDLERLAARPGRKGDRGRRTFKAIGPEMAAVLARRAAAVEPGQYLFEGAEPWGDAKPGRIWVHVLPYAAALGVDITDPNGPAKRIRPYITRSANISEKMNLGAPMAMIAQSVDHASVKTTEGYVGSFDLRPLAKQMELSLLGPDDRAAGVVADQGEITLPPPKFQRCTPTPQRSVERATATDMTESSPILAPARAKVEVADLIKAARLRASLTVRACARGIGVSEATWAGWEATGLDRLSRVYEIAAFFRVAPRALLPATIDRAAG